jgi:hypothetical protein
VYVDDSNGAFTPAELARLQDTIRSLDSLLAPYKVTISEVSSIAAANLVLDAGLVSASGGFADGVLGNYTSSAPSSTITMIEGWNWYAGANPAGIGAGQYDFETVLTHEFGHALGLGHNTNPNSVMYDALAPGTTRRDMTAQDLMTPTPGIAKSGSDPDRSASARVTPDSVATILASPGVAIGAPSGPVLVVSPAPSGNAAAVNDASAEVVGIGVGYSPEQRTPLRRLGGADSAVLDEALLDEIGRLRLAPDVPQEEVVPLAPVSVPLNEGAGDPVAVPQSLRAVGEDRPDGICADNDVAAISGRADRNNAACPETRALATSFLVVPILAIQAILPMRPIRRRLRARFGRARDANTHD